FLQAEDGIRDFHVTGVQTSALPIFKKGYRSLDVGLPEQFSIIERLEESYAVQRLCQLFGVHRSSYRAWRDLDRTPCDVEQALQEQVIEAHETSNGSRSEERRVGKEC